MSRAKRRLPQCVPARLRRERRVIPFYPPPEFEDAVGNRRRDNKPALNVDSRGDNQNHNEHLEEAFPPDRLRACAVGNSLSSPGLVYCPACSLARHVVAPRAAFVCARLRFGLVDSLSARNDFKCDNEKSAM
jgi:hypothetical protein